MGNIDFVEWLNKEIEQRFWRPADLAKAANLYPSTIAKVLARDRQPGPEVCLAIAKALKMPPEEVFRQANLLPPLPENATLKQINEAAARLTAEDQLVVLKITQSLLQMYKSTADPSERN